MRELANLVLFLEGASRPEHLLAFIDRIRAQGAETLEDQAGLGQVFWRLSERRRCPSGSVTERRGEVGDSAGWIFEGAVQGVGEVGRGQARREAGELGAEFRWAEGIMHGAVLAVDGPLQRVDIRTGDRGPSTHSTCPINRVEPTI